jgi:hypothetical protein
VPCVALDLVADRAKEKAIGPFATALAVPLIVLLLAAPFVFGVWFGNEIRMSPWDYAIYLTDFGPAVQSAGYETEVSPLFATNVDGALVKSVKTGGVTVRVSEVLQKRDALALRVEVTNKSARTLEVGATGKSPAGRGPLDYGRERIENILVAAGEKVTTGPMDLFLPQSSKARWVTVEFSIRSGSEHVTVTHTLSF